MTFMRNAWYAAGWASEAVDNKFSRVILGQPLVFFRRPSGDWAALANRCPHRFAPLDKGKVIGDRLQCGYHGLQFDSSGTCTHNPIGTGQIPAAARVEALTAVERFGMVWVWPGEASQADLDLLPDYAIDDSPDWVHASGGYMHCEANYQLIVDNLMDLSHVAFLHPLFGSEAMSGGKLTVTNDDRMVRSDFWMSAVPSPPIFEPRFEAGALVDHWLDMRWQAPSNMLLDFGATEPGAPRDEGVQGYASHILTPETETTTHYFFNAYRANREGAQAMVEHDHGMQKIVFATEDKPMLEGCQSAMGTTDLWSLKPVMLGGDVGAIRARRLLEGLIRSDGKKTLAAE